MSFYANNHMYDVLMQYIPMPVLYGVFLYMGVASLHGIQVRETRKVWSDLICAVLQWSLSDVQLI